jgi:hypothetical protein
MIFVKLIIKVLFRIALIQLSYNYCYAQLLRPYYQKPCEHLKISSKTLNLNFIVNEGIDKEFIIEISNPNNYSIQKPYFNKITQSLEIISYDSTKIIIKPKNSLIDFKEKNKIVILANLNPICTDTLEIISVNYSNQLFKKIRFLGRLEFGYLNNVVSFSDKSIQTNETYKEESNTGFALGCELVEFRAPAKLLYFGMSLGFNLYYSSITSYKNESFTNRISSQDLLMNFRGDLPFYFINKDLKDLSLRFYLSFPFFYTGSLSTDNKALQLNDYNNLKLFYGFGINYNLSKWCALEIKNSLENCQSYSTLLQIGSKINYNMIKSEFIFSFTNVYDNLYELLSE